MTTSVCFGEQERYENVKYTDSVIDFKFCKLKTIRGWQR